MHTVTMRFIPMLCASALLFGFVADGRAQIPAPTPRPGLGGCEDPTCEVP